jgi:Na+-transporting methylmalonyl-CoA/oxaloacetate decarboxylase gamma subunit
MSNIVIALQITALGMGLVFAAIILLWWMMALLTRAAAEKESPSDAAEVAPILEKNVKAQAAAAAVAMALADHQITHTHPLSTPPSAIVSAWQLGTRTRQLYQKGPVRRPRKIG